MSYLKNLLKGIEIEWKNLEEIASITIGEFVHKSSQNKSAEYPVYNGGSSPTGNYDKFNNTGDKIIVSARGAYAGFVNRRSKPYWAGNSCYSIGIKDPSFTNWTFVYYFLKSNEIKLIASQQKVGIPAVSKKQMESIQIPIPCPANPEKSIKIQNEIVRVLDGFTKLIAELTAELTAEHTARKHQYSYYREKLFSFEKGEAHWKSLGEVGELVRGNGLPKVDFTETGIPAIHYGQIYTYYGTYTTETKSFVSIETAKKLKKVDYGDVVITNTSENLEDVGKAVVYLGEEQAVTGGHATIFKPSKSTTGKFFAYFTQTEIFAKQKRKYAKGTKVIDVSATDMSKILIPLPSLSEQESIVSILEKFEFLTNSLIEGLTKEIELRKKQYEYYRDLLLKFPKDNLE